MSSVGGTWSPSPVILYGVATHNFIPLLGSNNSNSSSNSNNDDSKKGDVSSEIKEEQLNPHQVSTFLHMERWIK